MTIKTIILSVILSSTLAFGYGQSGQAMFTIPTVKLDATWSKYIQKYSLDMQLTKAQDQPSVLLIKHQKSQALFCRIEDKINENNQLHCFFRIGSLSYVNYLEQKGNPTTLFLDQLK
ncbi:hypothetical protein [Membranihabitans marinus]|uniref:hypothetical protein n=1 Tax=Membranihabitans marinus TaxID=1227546 RepID=UPI001F26E76C|nr:hypothetical protein [Membranihabitans marinus]